MKIWQILCETNQSMKNNNFDIPSILLSEKADEILVSLWKTLRAFFSILGNVELLNSGKPLMI